MTEHDSPLGILQDPLLMLLALMLLGSLPFLLPSGPAPEGPPIDDRAIARIEHEIAKLEADHLDLIATRGWRAGHADAPSSDSQLTGQLESLRARIKNLSALLEHAKTEMNHYKKILDSRANSAGGGIENEIITTQEEIRVLKKRQKELQGFVATRSGLPIYSPQGSKGRMAILAEAAMSQIYLIDSRNYQRQAFKLPDGGEQVLRIRKADALGEDSGALDTGDSIWFNGLSELDPNKYYVFFWVREDGFRVFLQARMIAQTLGYPVGWVPIDSGPIIYRTGRGSGLDSRTPLVTGGQHQ